MFILVFILILFPYSGFSATSDLEKRFDEAVALFQQKQDKEAEKFFLELLQEDSSLVRPHQFLGLIYARTHRVEKAIQTFENMIQSSPRYWGGHFGLGLVLKQVKQFERAKQAFRLAIAFSGKNPQAWFHSAEIHEAQKNMADAISAYLKVIKEGQAGSKEVLAATERLNEIGKTPEQGTIIQGLLKGAETTIKSGDLKGAIPFYEEAIQLLPEGKQIRHTLGKLAAQAGEVVKSETVLLESIRIDPVYLPARLSLGRLYELTGQREKAITAYETMLVISRDETIPEIRAAKSLLFPLLDLHEIKDLTDEANTLVEEEKLEEAETAFKTAIELDPENTILIYNLAQFYHQTDRHFFAEEEVLKALVFDPESKGLLLLLGNIYQKQRHYLQSIEFYVKVLSLSKNQKSLPYREALSGIFQSAVLLSRARVNASTPFAEGLRHKEKGDLEKALPLIKSASEIVPESPILAFYLGETYREKGEIERAFYHLKRAADLHSAFYSTRLALARVAIQQKKFFTAITSYQRLLQLQPDTLIQYGIKRKSLEKEFIESIQAWQNARELTRELFQKSITASRQGEQGQALSLLFDALLEEPENPSLLFSLGIAYVASKKWDDAENLFKRLLEIYPDYPGAHIRLASVYEAKKLLFEAKWAYEALLKKKTSPHAEKDMAKKRLQDIKLTIKRHQIADRHEKRGVAFLTAEKPDPRLEAIALWDLEQAVKLRPDAARFYFNLGLMQEKQIFGTEGMTEIMAKKIRANPNLLDKPIKSYNQTIRKNPNYLPVYARLARLHAASQSREKAIKVYQNALARGFNSESEPVIEIQKRLDALQKRYSGRIGLNTGIDSNFTLTTPAQKDLFNSFSLDFAYILFRRPGIEIPISYRQQTTAYYRQQILLSNHGLSLAIEQQISFPLSYRLEGTYQAGLSEGTGLSSLTTRGSASITYRAKIPSVTSFSYNFTRIEFKQLENLNRDAHQAGFSLVQRLTDKDEASLSYNFVTQRTPKAQDNTFDGHQLVMGYQHLFKQNIRFRSSGSVFLQNFLHIDSNGGIERENKFYSYGFGLTLPWTSQATVYVDHVLQKNHSNLGPVTLGRAIEDIGADPDNPGLGDYTKRLWMVRVDIAF